MAQPLIAQGVLNRLRASITFPSFTNLNITAPYLGKAGISLAFSSPRGIQIDTMTGAVQSPEPYCRCTVTANLIRSQALAAEWQLQEQQTTIIGDMVVRPDTIGNGVLGLYQLANGALDDVRELPMNGQDAGYILVLTAYYTINLALYNT